MRIVLRIWLMGLAMAGLPAVAQAQAINKFDGSYAGLPSTTAGGAHCPQMETPSALTISNGNVQSASGGFTGSVDAGGHVVLRTKQASRLDGQIDSGGMVKATFVSTHNCSYTYSWRKR